MLGFSTNGIERMRIDASGNVGIGTSTPSYLLDVNGAVRVTSCTGCDNIWKLSGTTIYTTSTGNVGIGTATPSTKLDVAGDILTQSAKIYFGDTNTYLGNNS